MPPGSVAEFSSGAIMKVAKSHFTTQGFLQNANFLFLNSGLVI
jgi:hypothetical protein